MKPVNDAFSRLRAIMISGYLRDQVTDGGAELPDSGKQGTFRFFILSVISHRLIPPTRLNGP
jgi:hypothetical protein